MQRILIALGLVTILAAFAGSAGAETRIALVVGNSAYRNIPRLDNPASDAKLIAETLKAIGFKLIGDGPQLDLDKPAFDAAVQSFSNRLPGADAALFYYAGHGLQVRGSNFLVPVSANPAREADVDFQMLDVALVLRQMESAGTRLNLVILDACRNNPFGGHGLRAGDSGLVQMRAPEGTLISFSTQPGNVALDGADGNSPYTKALAQPMRRSGLDVFQTFNEVGLQVKRSTAGAQQPWVSSSPIDGSFYFVPPVPLRPLDAAPTFAADEIAWSYLKGSTDIAALRRFVDDFPSSSRRGEAQARVVTLARESAEAQTKTDAQKQAALPPLASPDQPCASGVAIGISMPRSAQPLSAGEECVLKPRDVFRECDNCPEMVVLPAGEFVMGASEKEKGFGHFEGPQQTVRIPRNFAVGRFEITVDQFVAFVRGSGYDAGSTCTLAEDLLQGKTDPKTNLSFRDPGFPQAGSHPVVCVGWDDAKAYVAWLSRQTGKPYRLLSEAEWEYAARSGSTTAYHTGDDPNSLCGHGNGADQTSKTKFEAIGIPVEAVCTDGYVHTAPTGVFSPNAFELHDMHGNAAEWVEDCSDIFRKGHSYREAPPPADGSPRPIASCGPDRLRLLPREHIVRGGSWVSDAESLRSAARSAGTNFVRDNATGFRVARTLSQ